MKRKHCCEELAGRLGKGNEYPKPAYISPEDWERNGHLDWWYPGADGPGYYMIHELEEMEWITTPVGAFMAPKIEYRRMMECPYCGDVKRVICPECGASILPDGHCWYCENVPDEVEDNESDLGTCCGCGGSENVRNVICLDRKGPTPGKGWGCLVCGLPLDGAIAVLCDDCLEKGQRMSVGLGRGFLSDDLMIWMIWMIRLFCCQLLKKSIDGRRIIS